MDDDIKALRAECTGREVWRVADTDGNYCIEFSHVCSVNPEREARDWLARQFKEFPKGQFSTGEYTVQRVIVQTQLQELAARLLDRLEAAEADAGRYRWLRDDLNSDWAICEWSHDEPDGIGYYRDARAADVVDAAIDQARAAMQAKKPTPQPEDKP